MTEKIYGSIIDSFLDSRDPDYNSLGLAEAKASGDSWLDRTHSEDDGLLDELAGESHHTQVPPTSKGAALRNRLIEKETAAPRLGAGRATSTRNASHGDDYRSAIGDDNSLLDEVTESFEEAEKGGNVEKKNRSDAEIKNYVKQLLNQGVPPAKVAAQLKKLAEIELFNHQLGTRYLQDNAGMLGMAYMEPNCFMEKSNPSYERKAAGRSPYPDPDLYCPKCKKDVTPKLLKGNSHCPDCDRILFSTKPYEAKSSSDKTAYFTPYTRMLETGCPKCHNVKTHATTGASDKASVVTCDACGHTEKEYTEKKAYNFNSQSELKQMQEQGGLMSQIKAGDRVTIVDRFGKEHTGRAVMYGSGGWVLNMGGAHGTPGIADEENTVKVRKTPPYKTPVYKARTAAVGEVTPTIFRKWKDTGNILALFPYDLGKAGVHTCSIYEQNDGLAAADPQWCISATTPVKPEEYAPLKTELESLGYKLKPVSDLQFDALSSRKDKLEPMLNPPKKPPMVEPYKQPSTMVAAASTKFVEGRSEEITPVIFRKWKDTGDVLALFPYDLGTNDPYTCSSYEHFGQHGAADPQGCIQATGPCKPEEYADLKTELEAIGYILKPISRLQYKALLSRKTQLKQYNSGTVPEPVDDSTDEIYLDDGTLDDNPEEHLAASSKDCVRQAKAWKAAGITPRAKSVKQVTACDDCTYFKKNGSTKSCGLYGLPVVGNSAELAAVVNKMTAGVPAKSKRAALVQIANRLPEQNTPKAASVEAPFVHQASFTRERQYGFIEAEHFSGSRIQKLHAAGHSLKTIYAAAEKKFGALETSKAVREFIASLSKEKGKIVVAKADADFLKKIGIHNESIVGAAKCASCKAHSGKETHKSASTEMVTRAPETFVQATPQHIRSTQKQVVANFDSAAVAKLHTAGHSVKKIFKAASAKYGSAQASKAIRDWANNLKNTNTKIALAQIDCTTLKNMGVKLSSRNAIIGAEKCGSCSYRNGMHCGLTGGTLLSFPGMNRISSNKKIGAGAPDDGRSMLKEFDLMHTAAQADIDMTPPARAEVHMSSTMTAGTISVTAEWKGWTEDMPVQVIGVDQNQITPDGRGYQEFTNLAEAKQVFPDLDPSINGKRFSWAMAGEVNDGQSAMRFETWAAEEAYSR